METDGIFSTWVLRQDENEYEHEVSRGELHIEEKDGSLKIYVPRDREMRDTCYFDALPRRILSWMMTPPGGPEVATSPMDEALVGVILSCSVSAVGKILERKGVPEITEIQEVPVPVPDVDAEPTTPLHQQNQPAVSWRSPSCTPSPATSWPSTPSPASEDANYATPPTDPCVYDSDCDHVATPPPIFQLPTPRAAKYQEILATVVSHARKIARRDYGPPGLASAFSGLSTQDDEVFSCPSARVELASSSDQGVKISAAGELFVRQNPLLMTTGSRKANIALA